MNTVQWGVIGSTGIAQKRTIPGMLLANNAKCIAVMSRSEENVNSVGDRFEIPNRYTQTGDILSNPEIDAVYIASPLQCHKEHVFAAADAGKHILLEKPMGLTTDEIREMIEYCKSRKVKLGVGFMMRFHGAHEQIRSIISQGKIGEIIYAHTIFHTNSVPIPGKWRQIKAYGAGGSMMDMGIHCIDLLLHLTGLKVDTITAICDNQIHQYPDVEDAATAVMKMNNGAIFSVAANFNIPTNAGSSSVRIYGTKGSVIAEGTLGQTETGTVYFRQETESGSADSVIEYDAKNMYTKQIEAFSDAIIHDTEPPVTGLEGYYDQKIVEAIYESCGSKKHIDLE